MITDAYPSARNRGVYRTLAGFTSYEVWEIEGLKTWLLLRTSEANDGTADPVLAECGSLLPVRDGLFVSRARDTYRPSNPQDDPRRIIRVGMSVEEAARVFLADFRGIEEDPVTMEGALAVMGASRAHNKMLLDGYVLGALCYMVCPEGPTAFVGLKWSERPFGDRQIDSIYIEVSGANRAILRGHSIQLEK